MLPEPLKEEERDGDEECLGVHKSVHARGVIVSIPIIEDKITMCECSLARGVSVLFECIVSFQLSSLASLHVAMIICLGPVLFL